MSASLSTSAIPTQITITRFETIGLDGIPEGEGKESDCALDASCSIGTDPVTQNITVDFTIAPVDSVVIFHVYYVFPEMEEPPGETDVVRDIKTNYASYGFRID